MPDLRFPALSPLTFCLMLIIVLASGVKIASAQSEDLDQHKLRIEAYWLYSTPTITMQGANNNGTVNFNQDFNFNEYSTGIGRIDWKFTRKNHLTFAILPFIQDKTVVLSHTVTFAGQTFNVGLRTDGKLQFVTYAPGYQYDIFRRRRWHLGIAVQINLADTTGTLNASAQVTGTGVHYSAVTARGSLLAPLPAIGPEFRVYLTNSPRLFVEGRFNGMYFFGYGNFLSTFDDVGFSITKHISINAGYGLGSRLRINNESNRIGIRLTQKGPFVGAQFSF